MLRRTAVLTVIPGTVALALALVISAVHDGKGSLTAPPTPTSVESRLQPAARPNIIVVVADDMRVDDLAYAPNVRRLIARGGVTFANSFSPNPQCCPSRASFFTGRYSHNHGVVSYAAPWGFGAFDDSVTLPVVLRRSGYRTAFVGKYLNGYGTMRSLVTGRPSLHYVPPGWTDWYGAVEAPDGSGVHGDTYHYFDTPFNVNGRIDNSHRGSYQTEVIGGFARDLATRYHRRNDPFFLYLSFLAPHFGGPHEPGDVDRVRDGRGVVSDVRTPARPLWVKGRFDDRIPRAPGLPRDGGPAEGDMRDKPSFMRAHGELTGSERVAIRDLARQRAEAVYVLDREVGRLVKTLKRLGEWRRTVLMFTSDNGYFLGEHRRRAGKTLAHEPSLRVPFLVTGPGIPAGQVRYDPITTVDLPPTILELAGVPAGRLPGHDGRSRVDVMRDGDKGWDVPVVTEGRVVAIALRGSGRRAFPHGLTSTGIRTARYSYIVYADGQRELYDLARDANQLRNVVNSPRYADVRIALTRLLQAYRRCAGDACIAPLPKWLRASVAVERRLTLEYWQKVRLRYRT